MSHVLLVDGDALLTGLPTGYLTAEDLNVHSVPDGEADVCEALTGQYDVAVLNSMMPKMNGLDVLKDARSQSAVPVIMLTIKGDDIDHVVGSETGTDDHVPKPHAPCELLARINAILCRAQRGGEQNSAPNSTSIGDVVFYPAKRQATICEEPLELVGTEFSLLEVLMRRVEQVVSEETLSIEALDHKLVKFDHSIDMHISGTRHKLGDASLIQAMHGLGYSFAKS